MITILAVAIIIDLSVEYYEKVIVPEQRFKAYQQKKYMYKAY
jgi:hypothetical protein